MKLFPPLPEPFIIDSEEVGTDGDGNSIYQDIPLYTGDHMRAYARVVAAQAVQVEREWCANEADYWIGFDKTASDACDDIANAIRSHKSEFEE